MIKGNTCCSLGPNANSVEFAPPLFPPSPLPCRQRSGLRRAWEMPSPRQDQRWPGLLMRRPSGRLWDPGPCSSRQARNVPEAVGQGVSRGPLVCRQMCGRRHLGRVDTFCQNGNWMSSLLRRSPLSVQTFGTGPNWCAVADHCIEAAPVLPSKSYSSRRTEASQAGSCSI